MLKFRQLHSLSKFCFSKDLRDPGGYLNLDRLRSLISSKEIHTVNMGFPDHYGRLMGKRFDANFFLDSVAKDGAHACNYLLACDLNMETPPEIASWESGYGDYHMIPDWKSLRHYWIDGHVVLMSDLVNDYHERVEHAPREILKKQIERADQMGFLVNCASELEFFPFKKNAKKNWDEKYKKLKLNGMYPEDYNLMVGDRNEDFIYHIRKALNHSGLRVETSKGEAADSQHEINIGYSDALTMADNHVYYKLICKYIAEKHNKSVTFMAKPFHDKPGSSCHIHLSLFDKHGKNIFHGDEVMLCEKRQLKASKKMIHFLGGWMKYVLDVFPFYAPYVNSYKRFVTSSWAPTNLNAWSIDNRTAPFRIVGEDQSLRIEFRIPGADANAYLAFAASIASGLEGIEKQIEPPAIISGNVYDQKNVIATPKSLEKSLDFFQQSEFSARFLGQHVRDHYLNIYRVESNLYNKVVTDWELMRYFDHA